MSTPAYKTPIHQKVALANSGEYPFAIIRLKSGWVMAAEKQTLPGYCLLFSDPVAPDLNSLSDEARIQYSLDTIRIGDALLAVTEAYKINYETWGNLDPALHTHVVPRYRSEPDEKRVKPMCTVYDPAAAPTFDPQKQIEFIEKMRAYLEPFAR